jgi:hypothetical protein
MFVTKKRHDAIVSNLWEEIFCLQKSIEKLKGSRVEIVTCTDCGCMVEKTKARELEPTIMKHGLRPAYLPSFIEHKEYTVIPHFICWGCDKARKEAVEVKGLAEDLLEAADALFDSLDKEGCKTLCDDPCNPACDACQAPRPTEAGVTGKPNVPG